MNQSTHRRLCALRVFSRSIDRPYRKRLSENVLATLTSGRSCNRVKAHRRKRLTGVKRREQSWGDGGLASTMRDGNEQTSAQAGVAIGQQADRIGKMLTCVPYTAELQPSNARNTFSIEGLYGGYNIQQPAHICTL